MFSFSHLTQAIDITQLASFLLCLLTLRPLIQLGIMDTPVQRSAHRTPVPKGGGLAIMVAFLGGMALHALLSQSFLPASQLCLIGGALLLCTVAWIDDLRSFPARYKLIAQASATGLLLMGNHPPLTSIIPLFMMGLICTNSINFMDGLNGLASGVMVLTALVMAGTGITPTTLLLLASSLLGFMPFNFPKARIFMGDAGSQPCALILSWAWMSVTLTSGSITGLPSLFWLLPCLMAGFFWDVTFTLGRRLCAGDPLATAHRGHLYQLAVRTHIPATFVTCCHWSFAVWGSVAFSVFHGPSRVIAILIPQLIWSLYILQRARTHLKEKW